MNKLKAIPIWLFIYTWDSCGIVIRPENLWTIFIRW